MAFGTGLCVPGQAVALPGILRVLSKGSSDGSTCLGTNASPLPCSLLPVGLEAGHAGGHAEGWGKGPEGL